MSASEGLGKYAIVSNADDFGMSDEVNSAILSCFEMGLISNCSIMANMPASEKAVELAFRNGIADRIGLHLNVVEGVPLSKEMAENEFFCSEGRFRGFSLPLNRRISPFGLSREDRHALKTETNAQFEWYINHGFSLKHMDSHTNAHYMVALLGTILEVFNEYEFRSMRKRPTLPSFKLHNRLYSSYVNSRFPNPLNSFFDGFDYLSHLDELSNMGSCELMFHPVVRGGA